MQNEQLVKDLQAILGSAKVLSEKLDLLSYSYDSSFMARNNRFVPDVVITPTSTEEVSKVMKYAFNNNISVTPGVPVLEKPAAL